MRVLLDTNIVSEIRRTHADPRVIHSVRAIDPADLYLSAITIGELVYGIKRLPPGKKRLDLEAWWISLEHLFTSRILAIDSETARAWGEITAIIETTGRTLSPQDGLIAATALRHGLHLMTRNVRDFYGTGVLLLNPWEG